jgi:glycosyltransferase involved in cell wall biosynthesis/SAM-dependent methyltransferase
VRVAWIGPQPLAGGGVPELAKILLGALAETDVSIDAFMAIGDAPTAEGALGHPNIEAVTEPIAWAGASREHRSQLTRFLSAQRARAQAQSRLVTTLVKRHAERPYDLVYQFSQFELLALRRHLSVLPPVVVHPETHAAGELRWLMREARLAHRSGSRATWAAAAGMLATRSVLQRRDGRNVAGIIAPSRVFANHLRRDYRVAPERLHVVPNCIDLVQFAAPSGRARNGPVKILFVSRMAVRKGVDMVVALSHRIADLAGQVEIEAVGSQSMWSDYRRLLTDLHPAVGRYRAHIPSADLAELYGEADLLVQPSRFEPFALTVAEALARGVPIVASDEVGACEDVDPRCCNVFPAGDLDGFESAVRTAVGRARGPRNDEISSLARGEAERLFSPGTVAKRLREVLERARDGTDRIELGPPVSVGTRIAEAAWGRLPRTRAARAAQGEARFAVTAGAAMVTPDLLRALRNGGALPAGLGPDASERIVEWPWLMAHEPSGRVLDAGSTLNHAHILARVLPLVAALDIVTLAPEARSFPELGVSYLYADLRHLPMRDARYDTVVCLSVLEHVGLDASIYGAPDAPREAPKAAAEAAMRELRRVTLPGGRMLLTVPYGSPEELGWVRQFDEPGLRDLIAAAGPAEVQIDVFRVWPSGWQRSDLSEARTARYAGRRASAVACVRLDVPA